MAEFQIIETQRSIPGASPSVQGRVPTDTGAGMTARALGQFGAVLGDIGVKLHRVQGEAELTEKMFEANERFQQLHNDLLTETDPEKYEQMFESAWSDVASAEVKNGWAQRRYKEALVPLRRSQSMAVFRAYAGRVRENHDMALAQAEALYIRKGTPEARVAVEGLLKTQLDAGYRIEPEIELLLGDADKKAKAKRHADEQQLMSDYAYTNTEEVLSWKTSEDMRAVFPAAIPTDLTWIRGVAKNATSQEKASKALQAIKAQRETINNFTQKVLNPDENGWILDVEYNELSKTLAVNKEEKWSKIFDKQADPPAKKPDWKQYNKLERRVFDFWNGEANADISDLQTELAFAYKVDKDITEREYTELLSRLEADIPSYQRALMQELFAERKVEEGWYIGGAYEDIAKSNKALYDYTTQQLEKGKLPDRADMVERKLGLEASIETESLPKPETEDERNKLKTGTVYIDPNGRKRIKL